MVVEGGAQAVRGCGRAMMPIFIDANFHPLLHRDLYAMQQHVSHRCRGPELGPHHGGGVIRQRQREQLWGVERPMVTPHEDVVVADGKHESSGGGMAVNGGDGGYGEGHEEAASGHRRRGDDRWLWRRIVPMWLWRRICSGSDGEGVEDSEAIGVVI